MIKIDEEIHDVWLMCWVEIKAEECPLHILTETGVLLFSFRLVWFGLICLTAYQLVNLIPL